VKRSAQSKLRHKEAHLSTDGEADEKILKSYRLRKSVVHKIEKVRISEGQRSGKVPSAADVLENLVLATHV
jgi:hypothetical protein